MYNSFKQIEAKKMLKEIAELECDNSELNFNYCQPNADTILPTIDWNELESSQFKYYIDNNE